LTVRVIVLLYRPHGCGRRISNSHPRAGRYNVEVMRSGVVCVFLAGACACGRPFLATDGTLVIPEKGAHGASIVTANGFEFHDRTDVPERIVVRDPYEPWRAPVGFIVPTSGRFTRTSAPTVVATTGLVLSLRPSDTRVPSWGGEVLVRIDAIAPASLGAARWGEDIAIVLDGHDPDALGLMQAALEQLSGRDRVVVVDTAGARVIVPPIPASHRSLILAAVERALASPAARLVNRAKAVASAVAALSRDAQRRVLIFSKEVADSLDGPGSSAKAMDGDTAELFEGQSVPIRVVSIGDGAGLEARMAAVREFIPPAGALAFADVVLAFDATPAPSHVLEASGGDARWELEGGELALGELRAGDERTEVVRLTIPAWTPGESLALHVTARFVDVGRGGEPRTMGADLHCIYDDDIERLAESRHGDVIAYASALATVARLGAAFIGSADTGSVELRAHSLAKTARMHARSLALLARDMRDPASAEQAALLDALLSAADP
jgi:hypothetical protein